MPKEYSKTNKKSPRQKEYFHVLIANNMYSFTILVLIGIHLLYKVPKSLHIDESLQYQYTSMSIGNVIKGSYVQSQPPLGNLVQHFFGIFINPTNFTCCAWVYCKFGSGWQTIFGTRADTSGTNIGWGVFIWHEGSNSGKLYFQNANSNQSTVLGITKNGIITYYFSWYHVAVTFKSGDQKIYVNGINSHLQDGVTNTSAMGNTSKYYIFLVT